MKSVCFFNNKGGVGKTTLLCNIASYIVEHFNLKVIIVDADPQCNATQLTLSDKELAKTLTSAKDKRTPTILDPLRPLTRGEPAISSEFSVTKGTTTRFSFDLLPGNPRLALLEDRLSQSWLGFRAGDIGGARQTNWSNQLCHQLNNTYDIAFFDVGPSLGALNRSVLIGTDYFVTPMSCDIFSIAGVENISTWLNDWLGTYERALSECKTKNPDESLGEFHIQATPGKIARFAGYTVQQYIAKVEGGKRRPTLQFEKIRKRVPKAVEKSLSPFFAPHLTSTSIDLGDVPNMYSLVPMAQSAHTPIHQLQSSDGLVGAQYTQRENYAGFVKDLSLALLNNLKIKKSHHD